VRYYLKIDNLIIALVDHHVDRETFYLEDYGQLILRNFVNLVQKAFISKNKDHSTLFDAQFCNS